MTRQRVTLGDVAHAAGVSLSTASEALSGRGRISEATCDLVLATARAIGYRPNLVARGLRTGRTRTIGLHHLHAVTNLEAEYFREFVAGALEASWSADYDFSLLSSKPDRPRTTAPQVDGVIIADPLSNDLQAAELLDLGIPVVAGERYPPGMACSPVIAIAHERGLAQLLDQGYAQGARRPMLFSRDQNSGWGVTLRRAFRLWCRRNGVPVRTHVSEFLATFEASIQKPLLDAALNKGVDFIIVPGEHDAVAAISALKAAGLRVGKDLLLASSADAHLLEVCSPSVSAIGLRPRVLGAACAQALIDYLDDGDDAELAELTLIDPTVELRASTRFR